MRSQASWGIWLGLVLPGAAALGFWVAARRVPAPAPALPPAAATASATGDLFPNTPLWGAILQHAQASDASGPGAGPAYAASLQKLKGQAREITEAISERFDRVPAKYHKLRYALLFLVVELRDPGGEALLLRVAQSNEGPLAVAQPDEHHSLPNPARLERLTCVDGLAKLALARSEPARQGLYRLLDHPDRQIRLTVARTLFVWFPHDGEIQATLRARVRPEERFTIDGSERPYAGSGG